MSASENKHTSITQANDYAQADSAVNSVAQAHPRAANTVYGYGTAGFRTKAHLLDSVMLRMGMLAVVRARTVGKRGDTNESQAVGVMITASHNPEEDNGLKLVDPSGGMLHSAWESIATNLANVDEAQVGHTLQQISNDTQADFSYTPRVFVGRDTRASSSHLRDLFVKGAQSAGGLVTDYGIVTTPQLHYVVREHNLFRSAQVDNYYANLSTAFLRVVGDDAKIEPLIVDCANGVGSISLAKFSEHLNKVIKFEIRNSGDGSLNHECGSEHVQKTRQLPHGYSDADQGKRCASLDGDADRLVYFFVDQNTHFHLMDGDKITALVAEFLIHLVKQAKLDIGIGAVQTAYANGASTHHLEKKIGVEVACVPTGVKYVHHKAEEYEIGIYFEANGHGTVLFNESAQQKIAQATHSQDQQVANAANKLKNVIEVINQAIGDAISDLLLVETILHLQHKSLQDWDLTYIDLPSKQDKVKVADRNAIKTADAERKCVAPVGLQDRIDQLVAQAGAFARAFVRPSGTEDVVRVYAEAQTQQIADQLARDVGKAVAELAGAH